MPDGLTVVRLHDGFRRKLREYNKFAIVLGALSLCGLILPSSLQAQQTIETGTIEVAGSIGLDSGVDLTKLVPGLDNKSGETEGTKWNVGATMGYAIRSNLLVVGEFMRTHLESIDLHSSTALHDPPGIKREHAGIDGRAPISIPD